MPPGVTRYTEIDGAQIAYQVTGDGPVDFVYMLGTGTNFESWWDYPPFARMLERLASFGRLILFDRRGSGISDALPTRAGVPTWESYTEDLRAVLDAAGSSEAVVFAAFDGGPIAMSFAATSPERVRGLVLWNSYARATQDVDYPFGRPEADLMAMEEVLDRIWGTEELTRLLIPESVDDPELTRWHGKLMRGACTPASYARQSAELSGTDARPVLPLIRCPVLVMSCTDYPIIPMELGRYVADRVSDGRFVKVPGASLDLFTRPDVDDWLDVIEEFATGMKPAARADRVLASVLFTDIVGSTERAAELGDGRWKSLLEAHDATASSVVTTWRGEIIKTTGDGILATFDGPGRAVQSALDLHRRLAERDIPIRAGVHFGEIERRANGDVGGIAVHVAARAMGHAGAGDVVCTRTVKELSLGSGVVFEDRGTHALKGVPEEWQLFAVRA